MLADAGQTHDADPCPSNEELEVDMAETSQGDQISGKADLRKTRSVVVSNELGAAAEGEFHSQAEPGGSVCARKSEATKEYTLDDSETASEEVAEGSRCGDGDKKPEPARWPPSSSVKA